MTLVTMKTHLKGRIGTFLWTVLTTQIVDMVLLFAIVYLCRFSSKNFYRSHLQSNLLAAHSVLYHTQHAIISIPHDCTMLTICQQFYITYYCLPFHQLLLQSNKQPAITSFAWRFRFQISFIRGIIILASQACSTIPMGLDQLQQWAVKQSVSECQLQNSNSKNINFAKFNFKRFHDHEQYHFSDSLLPPKTPFSSQTFG